MMLLRDITTKDLIQDNLRADLRTDALRELIELAGRQRGFTALERESYLAEVLKRHDRTPSGLGRGIAFPSARIEELKEPTLAVGLSRKGLDFQARDGKRAHVILLYLGRLTPSAEEREMLSRLSRALADPGTADLLLAASTANEAWDAIVAIDVREGVRTA
jgi:PTS system fructose-specific IIC component